MRSVHMEMLAHFLFSGQLAPSLGVPFKSETVADDSLRCRIQRVKCFASLA